MLPVAVLVCRHFRMPSPVRVRFHLPLCRVVATCLCAGGRSPSVRERFGVPGSCACDSAWLAFGARRFRLPASAGCFRSPSSFAEHFRVPSPMPGSCRPPLCGTSVTFGAGAYPNICAGWFPSFSVCGISGCGLVCEALPSTCLLCEVFPCALLVCEAFADLLCWAFRQPPAECRLMPGDLLFRDGAGRSGRYTGVYLFQ